MPSSRRVPFSTAPKKDINEDPSDRLYALFFAMFVKAVADSSCIVRNHCKMEDILRLDASKVGNSSEVETFPKRKREQRLISDARERVEDKELEGIIYYGDFTVVKKGTRGN